MSKKVATVIKDLKKLQPGVQWLPIDEVHQDPANPRFISEQEFEDLKASITAFPEMMVLRGQGVINADNILQGSNQRHKACKELGWKEFPVIRANGLTAEQLKEFQIKDNLHSGNWNTEELFKNWNMKDLEDWNFNMDLFEVRTPEPKEPEPDKPERLKHQKKISLTYTEDEYEATKAGLAEIAETPELAVKKLLEFWNGVIDESKLKKCEICERISNKEIVKCSNCNEMF